jgi:hypothetical protein
MEIYYKNIKIDKLTFIFFFFFIAIYWSIGPTMWIDALFHVAYAETLFSSKNYENWLENNLIYHFHEGLGFGILWKASQIMGLKYSWLIFSLLQNAIFLISLIYLHSSLQIYFKAKLKFYTLFFIYSSTLLLFFNNSYMTEAIPISLIIISFSIYLRFENFKIKNSNFFLLRTICLLLTISFIISQFRIHWAFFPSFLAFILLIRTKKLRFSFIVFFIVINVLIINFNPFINYLKLNKYKLHIYGINKVRLLSPIVLQNTTTDFYESLSLEIENFLSKNKIPYNGKSSTFIGYLADHSKLAKYTKKLSEEGKNIFEIDEVFEEIYKKIFINNENIKNLEKKYKIKYFFWNSGLTYLFQNNERDNAERKHFRSHYRFLTIPDKNRHSLYEGWFSNINLPNINNSQDKIFDSIKGVLNKKELLDKTYKIFNLIFFTKKLNYEILASVSLALILLLFINHFFLAIALSSTILINNLVTSNALLSDARMMVLNYVLYVLVLSFYIAKIQSRSS